MRGRSLHVHGYTSSEPRSTLAHLQGRMPGRRATGACFFQLPFFARAKKGDSLARRASESSALNESKIKMDYSPHPRLALWAIRCANVRFGILPPQSSLRWNDEQKKRPRPRADPSPPNPPLEGEG
jgi:hypothetical protein